MKPKHRFFYRLLRPLVSLYLRLTFGYRYERAVNLPDNYIVLANHTTDYDPLLVAVAFSRPMAFVGSEHVARWGLASRLLQMAFCVITRNKGASAAGAVKDILRHTRAGENVLLFPEGVRSWDGDTCPILPSTAKLVKSAGCGLVTYRMTGGYFASPMWAGASRRRGRLTGAPVHVFTREQLAAMSAQEVYETIVTDLYEDAYATQIKDPVAYRHKRPAEGLENLLFVCPACDGRDTLRSERDRVTCTVCERSFTYTPYGMLVGTLYDTVKGMAAWQRERVAADIAAGVAYTAPMGALATVSDHQSAPVTQGPVSLDRQQLRCGEAAFDLTAITDAAMHGQRTLVFTAGGTYYELVVAEGANALKFMWYLDALKARQEETAR